MSLDAFEQAAKEADEGLPRAIGRIRRLHDESRLEGWIIAYAWKSPKGVGLSHVDYSDPVIGLGLLTYGTKRVLEGWDHSEGFESPEEADEKAEDND